MKEIGLISNISSPRRIAPERWAFVLSLLIAAGFLALLAWNARQNASANLAANPISQQMLEEKYGLRVNLIAVTAAGGMVDLRLKMLDGEKAKLLLQDQKNFPALLVSDSHVRLSASEDTNSQEIKFEKNGGLFLLFSNSGNAVKPGSTVSIVFGDIRLEPVVVK
jgi:hypothetical protein